ncbi:MAG TPA: hypothetical protein PLY16_01430 [Candidatus Saccharibacteria bacterium]|nr:hypothetical protein [Candidatus Saccharibacteria bacterium]
MSEETPTDNNEFEDAVQDVLAMNKKSRDKQAFEGAASDAQEMQAARDAAKRVTAAEQQAERTKQQLDKSDRLLKMGAAAAIGGLLTAGAINYFADNDKQPEEDIPAIIKQQDEIERRLQNGEIGPIDFENNKITIEVPEDSK